MTAINIYNTMIKPYFEFVSTTFYTCCSKTQIEGWKNYKIRPQDQYLNTTDTLLFNLC